MEKDTDIAMEKDDIGEGPGMMGSVQQVSAATIQSPGSTTTEKDTDIAMEKDDIGEGPGMTGSVQQVSAVMIQSLGSTTAMGKDDNTGEGKHFFRFALIYITVF
jgi:hypothetical protein